MSKPSEVDVPWTANKAVSATSGEKPPQVAKEKRHAAKQEMLAADLAARQAALDEARSDPHCDQEERERMEFAVAFQRQRLAWMTAASRAKPSDLRARLAALTSQATPRDLAYLSGTPMPADTKRDQRVVYLLGEIALTRYALTSQGEPLS